MAQDQQGQVNVSNNPGLESLFHTSVFYCCCVKIPDTHELKKEGSCAESVSHCDGEGMGQGWGSPGHTASRVRKQK